MESKISINMTAVKKYIILGTYKLQKREKVREV